MDELLKALAEAVRGGTQIAGPALHMYFVSQIVSHTVSYVAPCTMFTILGVMVTRTVKWCVNRTLEHEAKLKGKS